MANTNVSIMEKRKLNILYIATEYPSKKSPKSINYGGQASYLENISNLIRNKKHDVSIYLISDRFIKSVENGIRINQFGFKVRIPFLKKFAYFLNNVLISIHINRSIYLDNKEKKFDIIQYPSFLNFGIILILPRNCKKICRISGVTKLWRQCNNKKRNFIHILSDYLEKKRVQKAQKAFAPSNLISKKASIVYSKKIYTLSSPLVKSKRKILKFKTKKDERYLLFIGTLNRVKGIDLLANAFVKIFKKHKNIKLKISGRAEDLGSNVNSINYFFNKCKKFKARIEYLGILPKEEIFSLYSQAEAIIIPSRLDNYPNVMIESILFKKPIIGFLNSSLEELLHDGKTGFLAIKQNSENLYYKIDEFLTLSKSKKNILNKNIITLRNKLKNIDYAKNLINFYNKN